MLEFFTHFREIDEESYEHSHSFEVIEIDDKKHGEHHGHHGHHGHGHDHGHKKKKKKKKWKKKKHFFKKKKKQKHKKMGMKKFMMPLLIAYKLKFFTLIPMFIGKTLFHLALMIMRNIMDISLYMLIHTAAMQYRMLVAMKKAMRRKI